MKFAHANYLPRQDSRKQRRQLRQTFIENRLGNGLEPAGIASSQIDGARLIATDEAGSLRSGASQGNCESLIPRESAACRNGNYERNARHDIEAVGRNDQHGPRPLLLVSLGWVKGNKINIATLEISSQIRPS